MLPAGMRVYVRLAAHLRGRVGGLCGNFDGDTENDFTTRQGIMESTAELFGNSWKVSPSCPDVADQDLRDPCVVSATSTSSLTLKARVSLNPESSPLSFHCPAEPPQDDLGQEEVRRPHSGALCTLPC